MIDAAQIERIVEIVLQAVKAELARLEAGGAGAVCAQDGAACAGDGAVCVSSCAPNGAAACTQPCVPANATNGAAACASACAQNGVASCATQCAANGAVAHAVNNATTCAAHGAASCAPSRPDGAPPHGAACPESPAALPLSKRLVTESLLKDAIQQGYRVVRLSKGAIVTALARDYAQQKEMELIEG